MVTAALRRISATLEVDRVIEHGLDAALTLLECERAQFVYRAPERIRVVSLDRGQAGATEAVRGTSEEAEVPADAGVVREGSSVRGAVVHEGRTLGLLTLESADAESARALVEGSQAEVVRALLDQLASALVNAEQHADLRASEARVWGILDNTRSAVFIKDLDGRYILGNRQVLRDTGLSREELIGRTDYELFPRDVAERIIRDDRKVLDSGEVGEFEGVTEFPTGPRVFRTTKFPLRDRSGQIYGICGISTDISERKRAQRLEHLDVLGRLAGGIAHDLNNVLMSIVASAELIDAALVEPRAAQVEGALRTIAESSDRASDLTHKLLLFSSESHRPKQRVDLHAVIPAMATLLQSSDRRLELSLSLGASSAVILGDQVRLQAALLQLGVNAVDALRGSRRELLVATRDVVLAAEACEASPFDLEPGAYVELELRDSGIGIAPEALPRIFEPFYTTKAVGEGRGLGLAAVHGTVVAHGGSIEVRSKLGVGTQFFVRVPKLAEPEPKRRPRRISASSLAQPRSGAKVALLVDDERAIRKTVKVMLEMLGFRVLVAEDGECGVERFRDHHEELSLVLLDMVMPKLGGAAAYRKMHEIDPRIPVVVCSGYAPGDEVRDLERLGLAGFLAKPYRLKQLRELVGEIVPS